MTDPTEAVRNILNSKDTAFKLMSAAMTAIDEETTRLKETAEFDEKFFDAMMDLVRSENDFDDTRGLQSYAVWALRASPEHSARFVDAAFECMNSSSEKAWVRKSVLLDLTDSRFEKTMAPLAVELFRKRDVVLDAMDEVAEADKSTWHQLFEYRIVTARLEGEDRRRADRLFERYVLAHHVHFFPDQYSPSSTQDQAAIGPLVELVASGARHGMAMFDYDGNHNNVRGFPTCRNAFFELSKYPAADVEGATGDLKEQMDDDQIFVLASAILHEQGSRSYRAFETHKTGHEILAALSDEGEGRGQAKLRWLLFKLGALDFESLPEQERPKVPEKLASSWTAVEKQRKAMNVKRSAKKYKGDVSGYPEPIQKLLGLAQISDLLRVRVDQFEQLLVEMNESIDEAREELLEEEDREVDGLILTDGYNELATIVFDDFFPFATDFNGDTFFISPSFSNKNKWPVFRFHHDHWLGVSLEALSVPEFASRAVVDDWASRESFQDLVAELMEYPEPPSWVLERTTPLES